MEGGGRVPEHLNAGTVELYSFELDDRLNNITDISSDTAQFKVTDENEVVVVNWAPVEDIVGMRVDVLLDTTSWVEGTYKIYIKVSIPPETPILGPALVEVS